MKPLMLISMLLILSVFCYAQEPQESYTLFLLDFEDRSGIENPLLAEFNNTIRFFLSRQTGAALVRLIPTSDRDALLARAAKMRPDATLIEQGLLAVGWANADALVVGSYTKQGEQWSLQAQVYHQREGHKARQNIRIQGDSVYHLLDEFPSKLLQQFTSTSDIDLTTDPLKAYEALRRGHYEAFREGHEELENYNTLGDYDKTLKLLLLCLVESYGLYGMLKLLTIIRRYFSRRYY